MLKTNIKLVGVGLLLMVLVVGFSATPAISQQKKALKFGVVAWTEALAIGDLIKYIMDKDIGQPVEITNPDAGVAYTAVKNKDLDLFYESWLPLTHEAYWDKVASKVCDFGVIYEDASMGWVVPNYIPKTLVSSVTDLDKAEVRKKCGEKSGL